ncbi:thermonuclease family protein [Rhizobium binxianense]
MRPAAFFTGIGGIAVVVGLLMAGEARLGGGTGTDETATVEQTAPALTPERNAEAAAPSAGPTRGPAGASGQVPAQVTATPPQPADPPAAKAKRPETKKTTELARPVVENAGLLSFGERRLQLAGLIPTPADRICGTGNERWPCGMLAKTALRLMLRNRTITCDLDDAEWTGTATTDCRIGEQDIGTWLAENGWAEAAAGSPLAAAAEKAKQDRQGLHGDDPRRRPDAR